ncbi:MAG: DUF3168 domain-containing protein, partial [Kiritimatiellae bacterium]|nr:DUF3168 domain-containing protein [Kiritimatiellia bacterium]
AAIFGARVYRRGWVPQGPTAPYLVYFQVSSQHLRDVDGGIGQAIARVQIDAYTDTDANARAADDALRAALDNFTGSMGTGSNVVTVQHCGLDSSSDFSDLPSQGEEHGKSGVTQDYMIAYTETTTP